MNNRKLLILAALSSLVAGCGVVFTTGMPGREIQSLTPAPAATGQPAAGTNGHATSGMNGGGTNGTAALAGTVTAVAKPAPTYEYSKDELTAVTYYLPKDVLQVTAQVDTKAVVSLKYDPSDNGQAPVMSEAKTTEKLEAFDASVTTVADRTKPFLIDANSPGFFKNDSTITVSEAGLLGSVNTKTAGAAGAVVQSVLKLAGTALPFLTGIPTPTTPALDAPQTHKGDKAAVENAMNAMRFRTDRAIGERDSCDIPDDDKPNEVIAREFSRQYFGNRIEMRFALVKLAERKRLKKEFCDTYRAQEKLRTQLASATAALAEQGEPARIRALSVKVRTLRDEFNRSAAAHDNARSALNAAVAAHLVGEGVGTKKETKVTKFVLDLSNLPAVRTVDDLAIKPKPTRKEVLEALKDARYSRARDLFDKTGSVISISVVQSLDGEARAASWAANRETQCKSRTACIYYREAVLYVLKIWTTEFVAKEAGEVVIRFLPPEERLLLLVSAQSPVRALDLPTNMWTKRDTAIAFDARGRLVSLQRNTGSAAEDAFGAVQQAARGGITEYETSLASIKNINATKNAIELQPLEQKIALAQKQVDLLKVQASLDATSSNSQALIDTAVANIEKSLVEAQQQLIAAQNKLASDTAAGDVLAESTAMVQLNQALAAQIQQLKNEIELIKLKKDLADLHKDPAT